MSDRGLQSQLAGGMSRRLFLKTLGMASGSAMLAAQMPAPRALAANREGTTFQLKAAEPHPKYGGTLRYGVLSARPTLMSISPAPCRIWLRKDPCTTT
jgi:hypothetical protein